MTVGATLLTTLLGVAGMFLGLAILVQVIQEGWKYLFSTKTKTYERALLTFLGPWTRELLRPGTLPDLQVNGPFQLWRRRPRGRLLPMDQDDLVTALERTAAPWVRRALQVLRLEATLHAGGSTPPSQALLGLAVEVARAERGSPGFSTASEIGRFLESWRIRPAAATKPSDEEPLLLDARALLAAFREQFVPHITRAERTFGQLEKNFEYLYRRRNTVLTFVTAIVVTLLLDLPIGAIYRQAQSMTPEQAVALAEQMQSVYDSLAITGQAVDSVRATEYARLRTRTLEALQRSAGIQADSLHSAEPPEAGWFAGAVKRVTDVSGRVRRGGLVYLVECLITTLLISFGAPFWNDLAGALLRIQRGPPKDLKGRVEA